MDESTNGDSRVVQIEFALGDFDETPIAVAEDQARQEKEAENDEGANNQNIDECDVEDENNGNNSSNNKFLL